MMKTMLKTMLKTMDDAIDDFEFDPENIYSITGGKKGDKEVGEETSEETSEEMGDDKVKTVIEKTKPLYRRPMCSKYEYARILTILAKAIFNSNNLKDFIDEDEVTSMVDYIDLAYKLIKSGKWDAQLNNGYDVANLSELKINPIWEKQIEIYLKEHHESMNRELF